MIQREQKWTKMRKIGPESYEVKLDQFSNEVAGPSHRPAAWETQATVEELESD